jgi:hypothetical protein
VRRLIFSQWRCADAGEAKKRKAGDDDDKDTKKKKSKKEEQKPKQAKTKGPVDVEKQCGVLLPNGAQCARSLTCKSHSMGAKRAVPGRSLPYDMLLQAYQKKNQARQQSTILIQTGNRILIQFYRSGFGCECSHAGRRYRRCPCWSSRLR